MLLAHVGFMLKLLCMLIDVRAALTFVVFVMLLKGASHILDVKSHFNEQYYVRILTRHPTMAVTLT